MTGRISPRMRRTLTEAVHRSQHGQALHTMEEWQTPDGSYERVLWSTAHGLRSRGLVTFVKVTDEWYEPVVDAVGRQTSRLHPAIYALDPTPEGRVFRNPDEKRARADAYWAKWGGPRRPIRKRFYDQVAVVRPVKALVQWGNGEKFITFPEGAVVYDLTIRVGGRATGTVLIGDDPGNPHSGSLEANGTFHNNDGDWFGDDGPFVEIRPAVLCVPPIVLTTDTLFDLADRRYSMRHPMWQAIYDLGICLERSAVGAAFPNLIPDEEPDPDPATVIDVIEVNPSTLALP